MLLIVGFLSNPLHAVSNLTWQPFEAGSTPADPNVSVIEEASDHLTIQYRLTGFYLEEIAVGREVFHRIHLGGELSSSISKAGEPYCPSLNEIIRVPEGDVAAAELLEVEWKYSGDYNLYPRQLPRRDDGSAPGQFLKSDEAYSTADPYPQDPLVIGRVQGWGGVAVAALSLTPVRYYPASRRLEIARSVTVRIDFSAGRIQHIATPHRPSPMMNRLHRRLILNPPGELPRQLDADEDEPVRMLVVLKEEALEVARPLIDFHHNSGIRTEVWVDDDIDDPREVKDRVIEMFDDGLEYLFIIGDGYNRDPDIPMHFWAQRYLVRLPG